MWVGFQVSSVGLGWGEEEGVWCVGEQHSVSGLLGFRRLFFWDSPSFP